MQLNPKISPSPSHFHAKETKATWTDHPLYTDFKLPLMSFSSSNLSLYHNLISLDKSIWDLEMHENYASFHHFEYWHEGGLEGVLDYRGLFPIIMAETIFRSESSSFTCLVMNADCCLVPQLGIVTGTPACGLWLWPGSQENSWFPWVSLPSRTRWKLWFLLSLTWKSHSITSITVIKLPRFKKRKYSFQWERANVTL